MTEQQKRNIGRGVRKAFQRKRMSESMKESWKQRRLNNELKPKPCVEPEKIFDIAIKVLGYDEVASILRNAIIDNLTTI